MTDETPAQIIPLKCVGLDCSSYNHSLIGILDGCVWFRCSVCGSLFYLPDKEFPEQSEQKEKSKERNYLG